MNGDQKQADARAYSLLRSEIGAVESETIDFICDRRRNGADFTAITQELNRRAFPPPPWRTRNGRARWELQDTVQVFGWRR